jgi:twinkle protein
MALLLVKDDIDFAAYRHETDAARKVKAARDYLDDMIDDLGKANHDPGESLPWGKTAGLFKFRPGDVTLWAGPNGHGKSLVTGMVALDLVCSLHKTCIASFEMRPRKTLERMARQWMGFDASMLMGHSDGLSSLRTVYEDLKAQSADRLWLYDHQGTVDADQMISVARYCAKELGVQHLFIDSLMKCVKGEDDYNGQKDFVNELCAVANDYGVHIHLVHHIRKLENESKQPDKMDIKGSGAIADQVANVLMVWRNKAENRKPEEPDARVICCKQRNGEWEGAINLWFHRDSQQYLPEPDADPINFTRRCA